jgi:hypothetical protein
LKLYKTFLKTCTALTGFPRGGRLPVFDLNPFEPITFFQQQKISNQKMPPLNKVFNRTKRLILWAQTALSLQMFFSYPL